MVSNNSNIGDMQAFNAADFPKVIEEMNVLNATLADSAMPVCHKKDIVISFLKDHSIKTQWLNANPQLAALMLSGSLSTSHVESLFESCRWNKTFARDFERYVRSRLD